MRHIHFGFLFVLVSATAWGLEIPVRRGGPGGASVGYVDMELVFREYPEAKKAREEYRTELLRQKSELAQREQVLDDLKREIELLKRSVETGPTVDRSSSTVVPIAPPETGSSDAPPAFGVFPVSSTGTVLTAPPLSGPAVEPVRAAPPSPSTAVASSQAEISKREEILLKRQKELEDARASSAKSLKIFEASRAKTILGRLYKALVELANERGISLVVDKSAILYGENTIDLTESLNRRVRGLPAENP